MTEIVTTTRRTPEQIIARIESLKDADMFGFLTGDLIVCLPFESAKPYLVETATADTWVVNSKTPKEDILEYLPFAWTKANDCRGISAMRSMGHMSAWLWLDGQEELAERVNEYDYYGKPHLVAISELYGFDWQAHDSGDWVQNEGDTPKSANEVLKRGLHAA